MMAHRTMKDFLARAARKVRRLAGRQDYRHWYATRNLERDYWRIVGPTTKEEYDRLSAIKLQLLIDLGLTPQAKVLDVGCGTGLLTAALHEYLSECGCYHGTDISPEAVAFCRSRYRRRNFAFHTNEMTTLPLAGIFFDFIVFYSVFTHTYPHETLLLLGEACRLLADGGVVFADLFTAPLADRCAGDRSQITVDHDYFLRLLDDCGLQAELIQAQPGLHQSQRLFFKFTPLLDAPC
jgi:SAM-dependent methyltransferase